MKKYKLSTNFKHEFFRFIWASFDNVISFKNNERNHFNAAETVWYLSYIKIYPLLVPCSLKTKWKQPNIGLIKISYTHIQCIELGASWTIILFLKNIAYTLINNLFLSCWIIPQLIKSNIISTKNTNLRKSFALANDVQTIF